MNSNDCSFLKVPIIVTISWSGANHLMVSIYTIFAPAVIDSGEVKVLLASSKPFKIVLPVLILHSNYLTQFLKGHNFA